MSKKRGFAAMPKDKMQIIARMGGIAAHKKGTAHEFSSKEAKAAGAVGGKKVAQDRKHMAEIGRLGGLARGIRYGKKKAVATEATSA